MAKESMKAREVKRAKMVARYAEKRAKYLAEGDYEALQSIPKNASPVRLHNRCKITGRPIWINGGFVGFVFDDVFHEVTFENSPREVELKLIKK